MKKIFIKNTVVKFSVLCMLLCSGGLFAQGTMVPLEEWETQVHIELRRYEQQLDLSGQTHEIYMGRIYNQSSEFVDVTLLEGITYYILGVCDNDCTDLDLELYYNDELINRDIETDDYPLLSVTPDSETTYRIKVIMESCSIDPCRYGLAVYSK